ncbi:MAG: hypothetical protein AAB849_01220 [Patescibacteria group bacterium]
MNIHQRRLIVITFIALFLTAAPIVVLYTSGYRYNWQKNKVEQVGVLMLDILPADAKLYLNNELLSDKRPLRLADLSPNYYQILAAKDGYHSWQKNLEIKARESTLVYDITLFKNNLPNLLESGPVTQFSLSPDESTLLIQKLNTLWLMNLQTGEKKIQTVLPYTINQPTIKWSPDGQWIIDYDETGPNFVIANTAKEKNFSWQEFNLGSISQPKWTNNSKHIYGLVEAQNRALYQINFQTQTKRKLIDGPISDYAATDNEIFFIKNIADKTVLYRYRELALPIIEKKIEEVAILPKSNYHLGEINNNEVLALNDKNQIFLINPSDKQTPIIKLNGNAGVWGRGEKNNYLYYFNRSEIWALDLNSKQSTMTARHSDGISQVLPVPDKPYYLSLVNGSLQITELDDRGERNIVTLFDQAEITAAQMDSAGKNVYLLIKNNAYQELYRMEIQ